MTRILEDSNVMRAALGLLSAAIGVGLAAPAMAQQPMDGLRPGNVDPQLYPTQLGGRADAPATGLRPGVRSGDRGWTGGVFAATPGGQGFNPARAGAFNTGLRVRPEPERSLPGAPRLGPPADPAAATPAGAYFGYRVDNWLLSSAVRQGLGAPGLGGARLDLGASYGFSMTPRHLITLSGGLTVGQSTAAVPYYSALGAGDLSRSSYLMTEPGAGFRLSWRYSLDRNLSLSTTLGYDRAYGDVDGLQGLDRGATSFGTTFGYRW